MVGRAACTAALLFCAAIVQAGSATLVIRDATLIDLSGFGRNANDLEHATVVIRDGRIAAVGTADSLDVPAGARVIDAQGRFLVPGLIDVFGAQNSESQARAWLHAGVTTVFVSPSDPRRGMPVWAAEGPRLLQFGLVLGRDQSVATDAETPGELRAQTPALTAAELRAYVDAQRWDGYAALLLYYSLDLAQTRVVAARMRETGMIPIGEPGHSGTLASARAGVPLFVHANRYLIDLAPAPLRAAVADEPFGPARQRYMAFLQSLPPDAPQLQEFARAMAQEPAALVPTFAMFTQSLPDAPNPWREPEGAILDPDEILLPADPVSGALPPPAALWTRMRVEAETLIALHRTLARAGVRFVVGSGADAFGALPGIATHAEIAMLARIGLSPREALAAATANLSSLVPGVDYGVIRPGAHADLLLLDADPRRDVRHLRRISHLIVRGEERDRAALLRQSLAPPPL